MVRDFTGHGIHTSFHSGLVIPHHDDARYSTVMEAGMTFTIEPMLNLGTHEWRDVGRRLDRRDRGRPWSAQFEHTILVTADGAEILTLASSDDLSGVEHGG